jgi:hypothetical protein
MGRGGEAARGSHGKLGVRGSTRYVRPFLVS